MKLAIYADSAGHIAGLAVCRITFSDEPNNPREISIRAEPLDNHRADGALFKTHLLELPSHLSHKSHNELSEALHEIHKTMRLDLTHEVPTLRARTESSFPSQTDAQSGSLEEENQRLKETVVAQALDLQSLRAAAGKC